MSNEENEAKSVELEPKVNNEKQEKEISTLNPASVENGVNAQNGAR